MIPVSNFFLKVAMLKRIDKQEVRDNHGKDFFAMLPVFQESI